MNPIYDSDSPASAIAAAFLSTPDPDDPTIEPSNVVDGLYAIAQAVNRVADALDRIEFRGASPAERMVRRIESADE